VAARNDGAKVGDADARVERGRRESPMPRTARPMIESSGKTCALLSGRTTLAHVHLGGAAVPDLQSVNRSLSEIRPIRKVQQHREYAPRRTGHDTAGPGESPPRRCVIANGGADEYPADDAQHGHPQTECSSPPSETTRGRLLASIVATTVPLSISDWAVPRSF
jgi:hypothetical protein